MSGDMKGRRSNQAPNHSIKEYYTKKWVLSATRSLPSGTQDSLDDGAKVAVGEGVHLECCADGQTAAAVKSRGPVAGVQLFQVHCVLGRKSVDGVFRGTFSQSQITQDTKRMQRRKTKTFHDCIHGQITLPPLLLAVIDTPQVGQGQL
eukprot:768587-Hanusia_phi.AAC.5